MALGKQRWPNAAMAIKSLRVGTGAQGANAEYLDADVPTTENILILPLRDYSVAGSPTITGSWPAAYADPTDGSHGAVFIYMPGVGWRKLAATSI